jgi:hypothetical protein
MDRSLLDEITVFLDSYYREAPVPVGTIDEKIAMLTYSERSIVMDYYTSLERLYIQREQKVNDSYLSPAHNITEVKIAIGVFSVLLFGGMFAGAYAGQASGDYSEIGGIAGGILGAFIFYIGYKIFSQFSRGELQGHNKITDHLYKINIDASFLNAKKELYIRTCDRLGI